MMGSATKGNAAKNDGIEPTDKKIYHVLEGHELHEFLKMPMNMPQLWKVITSKSKPKVENKKWGNSALLKKRFLFGVTRRRQRDHEPRRFRQKSKHQSTDMHVNTCAERCCSRTANKTKRPLGMHTKT